MTSFLRSALLPLFACALCELPSASAQDDIRQKVKDAHAAPASEEVIDVQGAVYGLAFGATEDEVMGKFGKPSGYLRLDDHRTTLLYGKGSMLLCYDGHLDGLLIERSAVDWNLANYLTDVAPFVSTGWQLSNGIAHGMTRKEVSDLVKIDTDDHAYWATFSTGPTLVKLTFSHFTDRGEKDDAYVLEGLLMARQQEGGDHWSDRTARIFGHSTSRSLKGQKLLGLSIADSDKGVRIVAVFKNSPADKAGLRTGDLITSLNGESVVGKTAADFMRLTHAQDRVQLEITAQDGAQRDVELERVDGSTFPNELVQP